MYVELCSGNGEWVINKALAHRDRQWVAVEKKRARAQKIEAQKVRLGITHLHVASLNAEEFFLSVPTESVEEVYINYPDPWPKRRHAKRRLLQPSFMNDLATRMKKGGRLYCITDDVSYFEQMKKIIAHSLEWAIEEEVVDPENYGESYFSRLWKAQGKKAYLLVGKKR